MCKLNISLKFIDGVVWLLAKDLSFKPLCDCILVFEERTELRLSFIHLQISLTVKTLSLDVANAFLFARVQNY